MKTPRWVWGVLLAVIVAGALTRAWPLHRPLWSDEAAHWLSTARSQGITYDRFWTWTHEFESAPLSFLLPRLVMDLAGSEAEWALRLPSLVCGILCIPAAYWLGRTIRDPVTGLFLAALAAFDPSATDQSQQSRYYALLLLLTLTAAAWAVALLRDPRKNWWHWPGLGLVLGLLFATNQFGLAVWFGVGLAAVALLVGGLLIRQPHPAPGRLLLGLAFAGLVAVAINYHGFRLLLHQVGGQGKGWGAHLSYLDIAREIVVAAKDLVNLSPTGLLVYLAALVGLGVLYRHCKSSAAVLLGVALGSVLILFPFRKQHHFMDPRYLTILQPAVFAGLAVLASAGCRWVAGLTPGQPSGYADRSAHPHPARAWALALPVLVAAYVAVQAWQSTHLEGWYPQPDRWHVGPQVLRVLRERKDGEGVVFQPFPLRKLGLYYGLKTDPVLDGCFYGADGKEIDETAKGGMKVPPGVRPAGAWLIVGMVADERRVSLAGRVVDALAGAYRTPPAEAANLRAAIARYRVIVAHFTPGQVRWQ